MEPSSALGNDLDPNVLAGMFILAFYTIDFLEDASAFIRVP